MGRRAGTEAVTSHAARNDGRTILMRDGIFGWLSFFSISALNDRVCLEEIAPEASLSRHHMQEPQTTPGFR